VVDKVLLLRKLSELEEYLKEIEEYANVSMWNNIQRIGGFNELSREHFR